MIGWKSISGSVVCWSKNTYIKAGKNIENRMCILILRTFLDFLIEKLETEVYTIL